MAATAADARRLATFTQVLARLQDLPNYTWDPDVEAFHSSYDNWHFHGRQTAPRERERPVSRGRTSLQSISSQSQSAASTRPSLSRSQKSSESEASVSTAFTSAVDSTRDRPVVCRISRHTLRLEREFQLIKRIVARSDPECKHFPRPIEFLPLPPKPGNSEPLVVSIFEAPGYNRLRDLVFFGSNAYRVVKKDGAWKITAFEPHAQASLSTFLDFAIGATECLEILHHGHQIVNGELRGDAFNFAEDGKVVMINLGGGARSFDLTSAGWTAISQEVGIEGKLCYIAPEQTGRLPAEPDSRTDIYSLGILFYSMLCGGTPFDGATPLEIMQDTLSKRIPPVSTKRIDVPDALSSVITKMTMRNLEERYHSTSGLKHDLVKIRELLSEGDTKGLASFAVGSKDISCFFNLPLKQIGREKEQKMIIDVIEAASKRRRQPLQFEHVLNSMSSNSSYSDPRMETTQLDDIISDTTSSRGSDSRLNSTAGPSSLQVPSSTRPHDSDAQSDGTAIDRNRPSNQSINDSTSLSRSNQSDGLSLYRTLSKNQSSGRLRRTRRTHCEVVAVGGASGLGKSRLLQSCQTAARSHGYFALAKFDPARKAPFDPVLKLMSSVFRQIFSEADVKTEFHTTLRNFLKGTNVWDILHSYLDLPEWLLSDNSTPKSPPQRNSPPPRNVKMLRASTSHRRASSPAVHCGRAGHTAEAWLRSGGGSKSARFMSVFLEVIRLIAVHKLCIWCLEDVQFADPESSELIQRLVAAKIPLVLIFSYREEGSLARELQTILSTATRINLAPFTEEQTAEYVAETLHREPEFIVPLVAVLQEKAQGNPFYIREILDTFYRRHCVYYCWRENAWLFDLDKVFETFESAEYGSSINNDFISRRLQELPSATRKLLAWCSLVSGAIRFSLIQRLLTSKHAPEDAAALPLLRSSDSALAALNGALGAYVLMPADEEGKFRWSHDRYLGVAAELTGKHWDTKLMHYVIAKTMLDGDVFPADFAAGSKSLYTRSRHICLSVDLLKLKEKNRAVFRDVLYQAAETAVESGARSTGIFYYAHCLLLLQDDPWDEDKPDVSYQETLQLFVRSAESYFHQSLLDEALTLIRTIFQKAKNVRDMASAFVLQSRVFAIRGDSFGAFQSLKDCLSLLDMPLPKTTWEECDQEFQEMCLLLKKVDKEELLSRTTASRDETLLTIGPLFVELSSAAFWSNSLLFYQVALKMVGLHLQRNHVAGVVAMGYVYLATIAAGRFNMIGILPLFPEFALEAGAFAQQLFRLFPEDNYTFGRGQTLQTLYFAPAMFDNEMGFADAGRFLGHFAVPITGLLPELNEAMDAGILAGDRILTLLNLGTQAFTKQMASHDVTELEAWIEESTLEFKDWPRDFRGGVFLTAARQYARALQGKTGIHDAALIFSDEEFDSSAYMDFLETSASNPKRPKTFYLSSQLPVLVIYGFAEAAISMGEQLLGMVNSLWSQRLVHSDLYYLSLSYLAVLREDPTNSERARYIAFVRQTISRLEACCVVTDVNYRGWISLLEAMLAENEGDHPTALRLYEQAMDHNEVHSFTLDESFAYENYAEFLIRKKALRPARHILKDCISSYRRMSAFGKANQLSAKYEWVLRGTTSLSTVDVEVQTTMIDTGNTQYRLEQNEDRQTQLLGGTVSAADRTNAWVEPGEERAPETRLNAPQDVGNTFSATVGLDMLDLSSIMESYQVLSSELKVDKLMAKMAEIILESTGGTLCGIVVEDSQVEWSIACVATTDDIEGSFSAGVTSFSGSQPLDTVDDLVARQVTLYVLRFRETVFVQNLLEDDRFSNVSESYLKRNPHGKAIICIPIIHSTQLIGSIYVEGPPNSFTERNTNVLRLLVMQISISLANALLFKEVEKVSASNEAMLEMQKRALDQARAAEIKAKEAEAIAIHNMKLKEEAAKAKSLFLANVSHELRTPLNGVIGLSELLIGSPLNAEQTGYADSIRVCADTLLSIINDLLDYSKLEAGKMSVISMPISLNETIKAVVRALAYTNAERGLKTVVQMELDPELLVLGDPVRISQILLNLLGNSYKFTSQGSVTVRAVVDKESNDWIDVVVSVIDTGIGIPEEQREKLFLPFSQVESSSSRSYGGTGLGLSICKALIENVMGGRIWLESTPGVGTTVSFSLRFQKTQKAEPEDQQSPGESDPTAPSPEADNGHEQLAGTIIDISKVPRKELRVCIAEDNLINQKIAISFVKRLGFECEACMDGYKTIEALERAVENGRPFHLILMDVQMPNLDGYKATQLIRKHKNATIRNILIIAMTASAIEGDREKCLAAGMNNYLAKPVKPNTLKALLDTYLSKEGGDQPSPQQEGNGMLKKVMSEPLKTSVPEERMRKEDAGDSSDGPKGLTVE